MPTKTTKPKKPGIATRRPVKKSGNTKTVILVVAIVIVISAGIVWWIMKERRDDPAKMEAAGNSTFSSREGAVAVTSTEVAMAVARAKLQLESTENKDSVKVIIDKALGIDGREVNYKFDWSLNGQPAGDGSDRITGFKRGDRVGVTITPFEGEKAGTSRILEFLVANTPPRIEQNKDMKFDGKNFTYQIKGSDQDGDELAYVLDGAPEGMTIDPKTGLITWQPKEEDVGERTVKVKVSDAKGSATHYSFKINLPKADNDSKEIQK